jgi:hypothetical protein
MNIEDKNFVIGRCEKWDILLPLVNKQAFSVWLAADFDIWIQFTRQAGRIWGMGRRHYSARTIVEYLRHETSARSVDSEFKINNDATPGMAQLYMLIMPERSGFFELRQKREAA